MQRRTVRCGDFEYPAAKHGFTLAEALIAVALVGVGMVALLISVQTGTKVNASSQEITQATYLAQEVREWTLRLPFSDTDAADAGNPPGPDGSDPQAFVDDLDDLIDTTYDPPRNAAGSVISGLAGWSQTVHITWRDPTDLTTSVAPGASDIVFVEAVISRQGRQVLATGWLVAERE